MYGTPLAVARTPVFTVERTEQSDSQRRLIQGALEHLQHQRVQARLRAQAPAAPVVRVLEDLIPSAHAAEEGTAPPPQKTRRDFFGRVVPVSSGDDSSSGHSHNTHVRTQPMVKYKHQEGFTNAVKRRLTMAYFL